MKDIAYQIRLEEEKKLLSFMEGRINANLIHKLLSIKDREMNDNSLSSYMKGYNLSLSEKVGEDIYRLCRDVQSSLGLEHLKIEYFISSDTEINAASFFNVNYSEKNPHFIVFNSGLMELLDEPELRFVTGHEIGHLIYEHTHFRRIIQFIYPEFNKLPYLLRSLYDLWCKLGEISADRVGLMAVKDIEPATLAMFKLSSGLGQKFLKISYSDLVDMIDKILKEMSESSFHTFETHPANPIRVKALRIFYESEFWRFLSEEQQGSEDPDLNSKTDELVSMLKKYPGSDIAKAELEFLATAGFMVMASDEDISEAEFDHLNNLLSQYLYLPMGFIQTLAKQDNVYETLQKSASYILKNYPQKIRELYSALIPLILRDRKLHDKEFDIAFKIAVEELNIPFQEVSDMMLNGIRDLYTPME